MTSYVLSIDQGTTSTRASLFRADTSVAAFAQQEFPQHFPADGEVEHEPEDLWTTTVEMLPRRHAKGRRHARATSSPSASPISARPRCCGTAPPGAPCIAPSSGRTGARRIFARGSRPPAMKPSSRAKTGLLLDPYFSGTKLAWLLDCAPDVRGPGGARRARLRHRRHVSAVAAHRRQSARHRRHQRVAHAAVRHPSRPLGRSSCWRCSACPKRFCRRCWIAPPRSA